MTGNAKVAIVTGGGQGLGQGIAIALSKAGYRVAVLGRTLSKLEATASLCEGECLPVVCDLIVPDSVRGAFAKVAEAFGQLDVLVNNAASYAAFPFDEAQDSQIVDVVNQSLIAPMFCTREAIGQMKKAGGGDIVNISTQSVLTPQPLMIVYGAAKGGLETLARGLRNEYRGQNIRVLNVQIGVVTNTALDVPDEESARRYGEALANAGMEKTFVFPGSKPADIAASIVHAVTAPRDTIIEEIVLRGF
ncbi:MAG: SDR family oxidoreductase [Sphingomonadaceae bacterium]|nr:SDR family oxidoreductase [Sphingomonadaceae bacterium]